MSFAFHASTLLPFRQDCNWQVAMALKFTVHGVQSFIKGHRKSGVISIKHSRDVTDRISPLRVE